MSSYFFRCPEKGVGEFFDTPGRHRCPFCNGMHETHLAGAPEPEAGFPNVVPEKLAKHFDYAAGCEITSRSQRNKVYAEKGLQLTSAAEWHRKAETNAPKKPGRAVNYPGMKDRRSSDERAKIL